MQNFNQERLKLKDATIQLENQINNLTEDLQRLKSNPKATKNLIFFKQQQIKQLIQVKETFIEYEQNTNEIFKSQEKEKRDLENENFKLLGICFYHGISNVAYYLSIQKNALIQIVKNAFNEGWRQTPLEILNPPALTKQEKKEFATNFHTANNILNHAKNQK